MNTFVIARRELAALLASPLCYLVGAAFLFVTGLVFFFTVAMHNVATLHKVFDSAAIALLFTIPVLTMSLVSKEAHTGTLELLLTTPIRDWEVVAGKFVAAFLFFLLMLTPTLSYLLLLKYYGNPDVLVTLSGYLGIILLGAMLISLGILASALATNQIVAVLLAIMLWLPFWLAGGLGNNLDEPLGHIFTYLSFQEHFTDFVRGLVATNHIVYFLSVTTGALFITTHVIQARR